MFSKNELSLSKMLWLVQVSTSLYLFGFEILATISVDINRERDISDKYALCHANDVLFTTVLHSFAR